MQHVVKVALRYAQRARGFPLGFMFGDKLREHFQELGVSHGQRTYKRK